MMITYQLIRSMKGGWRVPIYPKDLSILKTLIGVEFMYETKLCFSLMNYNGTTM